MDDLPKPLPQLLQDQNPSLVLAIAKKPSDELRENVDKIARVSDTTIDGVSCPSLLITLPDHTEMTLALDPKTHLLRQVKTNLKAQLEASGVPDVQTAVITVTYSQASPDEAVAEAGYAWKAPDNARDISKSEIAEGDDVAAALEGKVAPAFKLTDLDGKQVSSADIKGSVAVLDFWATWCGPCRESLPHIAEIYDQMKGAGLKVYAVNVQEEKEDVQKFVQQTKLTVPVLLDGEGKATEAYLAHGIPETVLIGRDGKIRKVIIGYSPEAATELAAAVQKALHE